MKKFLKYTGGVFFCIFILMIILDKVYSYTFKHGTPRSKIQNILQLQEQHYDLAFFGSSRTENHIDCALIEKITGNSCVNFGISGGTVGDMLVLMKLAKKNNVSFDHAFMQVDYNYNGKGISKHFRAGLAPFLDNSVINKELSTDIENFSYNWIPFYRYMRFDKVVGFREFLSIILKRKTNVDLQIGFSPKIGIGTKMYGNLPKKLKDNNTEIKQMQELYKGSETELHFFSAPYCPTSNNRDLFDSLEIKIPEIKNYSRLYDSVPEYFFNCGHLNLQGAKNFTEKIVTDYNLDVK